MEAQTRKCGILNSDGRIKDAEDQPEPLFVFGPDAGIASSLEKSSQSLMGKTANHETKRNLLRDRLQRVLRQDDYVLMVGGARDGSRLARVLYPRLSEHELIEALKHLVRAIRDRNPNQLPAGDYLDQTPDTELKAS